MKTSQVPAPSTFLLLPLLLSALCSCQKVVTIDLNQSNPQMVIEGVVTDQNGPYTVTLSKTGDYFVPSLYFPPISHALVTIFDNLGDADTLREVTSGSYLSSTLKGVPGRTYTLRVVSDGKEYEGASSMPVKVRIDSLYTTPLRELDGDRGYNIYVLFHDPPEVGNWYRLEAHTNVVPVDSVSGSRFLLYDDQLQNGQEIAFRIRAARNVNAGDTLTVRLFSIDRATYEYFSTVNDILASDRSPLSLSPANPNTNLSNGCLGYFAAYTIDSVSVVLP